jgi:outer membrane murein-binding lipoprotein Lpp
VPVITIPKALRDKLGDEAAESFAILLKEVEHEGRKDALVMAEEKFERRLTEEIGSLKVSFTEEIGSLKVSFTERMSENTSGLEAKLYKVKSELEAKINQLEVKISEVKSELEAKINQLEVKISEVKSDIIKWMFIFWAGQIVVLIAILQIFFR